MDETKIIKRIDIAIRFFLYLLIFWLPYSSAVVEISVIFSLVLWVVKRALVYTANFKGNCSKNKFFDLVAAFKPTSSILNRPICFFLIFCMISVAQSQYFAISFRAFFTKTLEWFIVYFLVLEVFREKKHIYIALGVLLFTAFSTAIDGIIQFHVTGRDIFLGRELASGRATAGFDHPNGLGAFLAVIVMLSLSLIYLNLEKLSKRLGLIFGFFIMLWALIITFSRGAWLATLFGLIFLLSMLSRKFISFLLIGLFIIYICLLFFSPVEVKTLFRLDNENISRTLIWRFELWEDSIKMIRDKPFWGHGLNTFMTKFQFYHRRYAGRYLYHPTYAHNCYLQIAAEVGIFGLLCFLWIFKNLFLKVIKLIQDNRVRDDNMRILLIGLISGIFTFLMHSFLEVNLYSLKLSVYFWFIVGIIIAIYKILLQSVSCEKGNNRPCHPL